MLKGIGGIVGGMPVFEGGGILKLIGGGGRLDKQDFTKTVHRLATI
jgi:hypothetical protein